MKVNGMCPICYIKQIFMPKSKVTDIFNTAKYENNIAKTPPMGWSSWNSFKNLINQDLIYETAVALKEKGLLDAGYQYVNLDDNWHSSQRDANGELQGDLTTFASGIPTLVKKINALGFKVGAYSSNGTLTCEDLPASLGNEARDAYTLAKWGIEYFKYDFCHNIAHSKYAPLVSGISISKKGEKDTLDINCKQAELFGLARFMTNAKVDGGMVVSGLDKNLGAMQFNNVNILQDGEYILTVNIRKKGQYTKFLMVKINDADIYTIEFPPQKFWNYTARFQIPVTLRAGINTIRLFNPIGTRADSAMIQYRFMGEKLKEASARVAKENNQSEKPIVFSICEWGRNQPWKWGMTAGNSWRTTGDIFPRWWRIMQIYEYSVKLHEYSGIGAYNDPDMLEVGNGSLTKNQNIAHFSLWCMMNSPLILGNDIRTISDSVLKIITNKDLIAINQDALCKQAKRIKKSRVDILVKPLMDGKYAICFFNKSKKAKSQSLCLASLQNDEYLDFQLKDNYNAYDVWDKKDYAVQNVISAELDAHSVKVFVIS